VTVDQLLKVFAIQAIELQAHRETVAALAQQLKAKDAEVANLQKLVEGLRAEPPQKG